MNADEEVERGSAAQGPVTAGAAAAAAAAALAEGAAASPAPATPAAAATADITAATAATTAAKTAVEEAAAGKGAEPAAKRCTGLAPSTSFKACHPALSQETIEVVQEMGFESMTPVQVCSWCIDCVSFFRDFRREENGDISRNQSGLLLLILRSNSIA